MDRNISLDILKIILACMVVGLHASFLADITQVGFFLTANGIFRISVPIFLLINGYFFYVIYSQKKTLFWFKKVFYLYLFWMIFYSYFWFNPNDIFATFKEFLIGYWHLWYLASLLGASILVILFNKISSNWSFLLILITFSIGVAIQYLGNYHIIENPILDKIFNTTYIHRNFIFFALPFFYIGFLINKLKLHQKISYFSSLIFTLFGLILLLGESYFNYIHPSRNGGFDNFISLIIIAPSIFILFMKINIKGNSKVLALYANGIYFIHPFFLLTYSKFINLDQTILTIIVIILSTISSYFLIQLNKKVKFIL